MKKLIYLLLPLVTLFVQDYSYADLWLGWRNDNATVSVFFTQSVTNSSTYTSIFNSAIANWNNISSKVSLTKVTSSASVGTFVYVSTTATPWLLWMMFAYKTNSAGQVIQDSTAIDLKWPRTDVYIYSNTMDSASMTTSQKIANATHELGHTLKLAHPGLWTMRCSAIPSWQTSIMSQGIQSTWPQTYDKNDIKYKWGL